MVTFVSGEEMQDVAYHLVPLTPKGFGLAVETSAMSLGIVSIIVISLRVYMRLGFSTASRRACGLDDILALFGTLPFISAVVFAVYATRYGLGARDIELPSPLYQVRAAEYVIYWKVLYLVSSNITKCAVGFTCMRLDSRRRFTIPISISMSIVETLGKITVNYIIFIVQLATDWIFATIPFFIVAGMQMRRRQKVSVICVLGLGILASISACIRVPFLKYYDTTEYPENFLYHLGIINICSNIECGLGVIGCSLHPLHRIFNFGCDTSPGIQYGYSDEHAGVYYATASRASRGRELEADDDTSSLRGIIRKTEVRVFSSSGIHL
ncbi:hypothetical protein J7T55_010022 [Diaporthe amygdali]|uniref:uncharacterized protein n=1 Tax=Phomopsis amygdali TaxID=1214568 RepID=UPI0022FECF96|nr:uncharacterized protein J7T55_010022 [Diaporthe amygdali]KAJ0116871.1 hypothetical protein J7T55_010022 [Diaporthe amygdali]